MRSLPKHKKRTQIHDAYKEGQKYHFTMNLRTWCYEYYLYYMRTLDPNLYMNKREKIYKEPL
jgi:hypothetical protein